MGRQRPGRFRPDLCDYVIVMLEDFLPRDRINARIERLAEIAVSERLVSVALLHLSPARGGTIP